MAQKLFSTGPGGFRRAERKEAKDDLERTALLLLAVFVRFYVYYCTIFIINKIIIIIKNTSDEQDRNVKVYTRDILHLHKDITRGSAATHSRRGGPFNSMHIEI